MIPRLIIVCATVLATGTLSLPALAGDAASSKPVVVARAVGEMPTKLIVQYVAANAEPTHFNASTRPDLAELTARELVESLCGSLQDGYLDALARANPTHGGHIDFESPLGEAAFSVQWPACLFARSGANGELRFQVRKNDTLTAIRETLVGDGRFIPAELNKYFDRSGLTMASAKTLFFGQDLSVPYFTAATALYPKTSSTEFLEGLAVLAERSVSATEAVASPGDIIGPVKFDAAGGVQGTKTGCSSGDGSRAYPFDPKEVASAFHATAAHAELPERLTVVVADNGFFGVPCLDPANCPLYEANRVANSDRFPRSMFDYSRYKTQGGFGPSLEGGSFNTLNYWNARSDGSIYRSVDVNEDTGHGTHVAGLLLGGPLFVPFRDAFFSVDGRSWLTMVVVNLSGGSPQLAVGSDRTLSSLMRKVDGRKIVNMSLAFRSAVDEGIPDTIRDVVKQDDQTLFVVAAGNNSGALDDASLEFYPARLGGGAYGSMPNVITVASVDGPVAGVQALSAFSNYSAKYVDIAAPGCQLSSWLNDEKEPVAVSGTSQAAPIVSFSAALLQMLWQVPAAKLKNRVLYSGDLLDLPGDQSRVFSMSRVNVAKSLTFLWDRLTYERDGQRRTLLGQVSALSGFHCGGNAAIPLKSLRSIKLNGERYMAYTVNHGGLLEICDGKFDTNSRVAFIATKEVLNGGIVDAALGNIQIAAGDVVEIVMNH